LCGRELDGPQLMRRSLGGCTHISFRELMRRRSSLLAALSTALVSSVAVISCSTGAPRCEVRDLSPAMMRTLEAQGRSLRAAIEARRREVGAYPQRLAELASVASDSLASCGTTWTYRTNEHGYQLHLGDYGENGFVLYWAQSDSSWNWDT
jgi:hypothetical protein